MKAKLERLVGRIEAKHKELARCVVFLLTSVFSRLKEPSLSPDHPSRKQPKTA